MNRIPIDSDARQRTDSVLSEVAAERAKQDAKWGRQDHPSLDPVLEHRPGGAQPERMCTEYEIPHEDRAKYLCDEAAKFGYLSWPKIVVEELSEAVSAPTEQARRRECVQLAAVVVGWIEAIDRRGR